jgi:mono/diheme cytochrome c family protein
MKICQRNFLSAKALRRLGRHRSSYVAITIFLMLSSAAAVVAQSINTPSVPPDALTGRTVYNDNCVTCHGISAMGDGEAVSQLGQNIPTALAGTDFIRSTNPSEMFQVITEGRIDNLMPPFGVGTDNVDPLPEEQRWDVIAYVYSLATPQDSIEIGQFLYEENCLTCHGEGGRGDGASAGELEDNPGDLSDLSYWSNVSNQDAFEILRNPTQIPYHEFDVDSDDMTDDELWSVVDYIRTFSYSYFDASASFKPLESAFVSGNVINGTTGEPYLEEGSVVELRAYNQDLVETLAITTTLSAEGAFAFELSDLPLDQFYRVTLVHGGVEYGSDFGGLTPTDPELDLPITVFETSTESSVVEIERLHQIINFFEGAVGVNELYVVNNNSNSVFVGESGDPDEGTFEILLPDDAQEISFQRAFGSMDNFVPTNDFVFTGSGWADTFPLRPGPGSLVMLVSYALPYDDAATISHPILYSASAVNLALPDVGVTLVDAQDWADMGQLAMGSTNVSNFGKSDIPAGSVLILSLEGEPELAEPSVGSTVLDSRLELFVGIGVALLVAGIAVVFIRRWQNELVGRAIPLGSDRDELLQAIADLDDDYEAGLIGDYTYQREREQLKADLIAVWEEEQGS